MESSRGGQRRFLFHQILYILTPKLKILLVFGFRYTPIFKLTFNGPSDVSVTSRK